MAALGQTITIVNKSGKIVTSGKHITNLWNEAKAAYREKKAELKVDRDDPEAARRRAKDKYLDENERLERDRLRPVNSRRSSSRHSTQSHRRRRRYDEDNRRSSYDDSSSNRRSGKKPGESSKSSRGKQRSDRRSDEDYYEKDESSSRRKPPRRSPPSPPSPLRNETTKRDVQRSELARRHSDSEFSPSHRSMERPTRVSTSPDASVARPGEVDMDLAYGELPPPLPARPGTEEAEIRHKATALNSLLEEMNCLHHSVSTIMKSLEKNPEAMAAVALTLAEISNLARKLAPGALAGLRATAPAVVALLASPEFLIAAGVGVGMTVIMFGGYKIIKKIRMGKTTEEPFKAEPAKASTSAKVEDETEQEVLEELSQADRIKEWRRGIDNADVESVATSVEGELATPGAHRRLIEEGVIDSSSSKPWEGNDKEKKEKKDKSKDDKKKDKKDKDKDSKVSKSDSSSSKKDKGKEKEKEPSGLRMLFKR